MLNILPRIYPDELWGSVISRTFALSGYVMCKSFAKDIFKGNQQCLNNVFINSYRNDISSLFKRVYGTKEIINHTLIPYYLLTSGPDKKHFYIKATHFDRSVNKNLAVPKTIDCHLKYCEQCGKEEIEQYGEPYWHLSHQVLNYCPKHCCKLTTSNIPYVRAKWYSFPTLSDVFQEHNISVVDKSNINVLFDQYIVNVLNEPISFAGNDISEYLRSVLPDCYFKDLSKNRIDSIKLLSDIKRFFYGLDGIEYLTAYRVRSIFNSTQINVRDYLLIACFLGLSPRDVSKAKTFKKENKTVNRIVSLYKERNSINYISRVMLLDRRVIRRVLRNTKVLEIIN